MLLGGQYSIDKVVEHSLQDMTMPFNRTRPKLAVEKLPGLPDIIAVEPRAKIRPKPLLLED